jgi:hypothetical protein
MENLDPIREVPWLRDTGGETVTLTPRERLARRLWDIMDDHRDDDGEIAGKPASEAIADDLLPALTLPDAGDEFVHGTGDYDPTSAFVRIDRTDWLTHKAAVERLLGDDPSQP